MNHIKDHYIKDLELPQVSLEYEIGDDYVTAVYVTASGDTIRHKIDVTQLERWILKQIRAAIV